MGVIRIDGIPVPIEIEGEIPTEKELERINKLPKNEKKFAKSLFLYKYLELIALRRELI